MPWISIGLSARGKLRSAISLITRGKFSSGEQCTIIDRDIGDHARKLNIYPWRKVWNKLADIWDILTTRGYITAVHKSWDRLALVTASKIEQASRLHFLDLKTYTQAETSPIPIQLYFATADDMILLADYSDNIPEEVLGMDEGVIVCKRLTPCSFELPEYIRDIFILQDYLNSPDLVLTGENEDYIIYTDIQYGKKGEIYFSPVVLNRYMWVTAYREKKNQEMVERFGPEVGYNTVRADEYDTFCDLFFLRFLQSTGISNRNLELGLTIMQNWPYTRFKCIVQSITNNTSMKVLSYPPSTLTEGLVYEIENDNGLNFQIFKDEEWTDLKSGDVIEAGIPVTAAVRCFDLKNEPDLAKKFPINYLERFHKTVIAFNSDIDYLDDEWSYINYAGAAAGFTVGDMVTGSISGAWGYIIQSMHGGLSGKIELRRVVGSFQLAETISDEHGNQAELSELGNPVYNIDNEATSEYLIRNKRTGSDFTTLIWLEFAPGIFIHSTYGALNACSPNGCIETDMMDLFSPSILFKGTALAALHTPYGGVETDYALSLRLEPEGHIETDYGMMLAVLNAIPAQGTWGGYLDYMTTAGHTDFKFITGQVVTGGTSFATGVVTSFTWDGITGELKLRHIQGIFQSGEVITGETAGDVIVFGILHP